MFVSYMDPLQNTRVKKKIKAKESPLAVGNRKRDMGLFGTVRALYLYQYETSTLCFG